METADLRAQLVDLLLKGNAHMSFAEAVKVAIWLQAAFFIAGPAA